MFESRFSWGSRKNFQYKFFNYLMTNNDVGLSEIVQQFFHGLDFQSLLHCRLVCKAWYRFLNQFPSFWMDSLTEAREKFLYEPRNYMKRWRILQFSVQLIIVFSTKVHIFWKGHKILRNLHRRFVLFCTGQIYSGFRKICWPSQNMWISTRYSRIRDLKVTYLLLYFCLLVVYS